MAQASFGRAFVAAGGTLLVLGGGTLVVSVVSMTVTRLVIDQQKKKKLITCRCCSGRAKLSCDVCQGERTLKYHPAKTAPINQRVTHSACAMCEGTGEQPCLNCLGDGQTMPLAGGLQECIKWLEPEAGN